MSELAPSRRSRRTPHPPKTARPGAAPATVPVVLPLLTARVDSADQITVRLDGEAVTDVPIGRGELGELIDRVLREQQVPVRVSIVEEDGTTYTDVLTPPPPAPDSEPDPPEAAAATDALHRAGVPVLFEVTGDGFIPGEDVALAMIIRHSSTDGDGNVRHLIEDRELAAGSGEVLLFGRISGNARVIGDLG